MLIQGGVAKNLWREAISTTVYTMNQILVKRGKDKAPYEYMVDHLMSIILIYLVVNVLLREVTMSASLRLKVMKVYFLVTPPRGRPTNVITTGHRELLRVLMFEWMSILKSQEKLVWRKRMKILAFGFWNQNR